MKTIKIEIEVTEKEYALLVMARSEQPHPSRIKRLLLGECASRLKRMANLRHPPPLCDRPEQPRGLAEHERSCNDLP